MIRELLTVAAVMLVMDAIWLTANNATHRTIFAAIQGQPMVIRWIPAMIVYILMIAATWYLAVEPAKDWKEAAGRGALLGAAIHLLPELFSTAFGQGVLNGHAAAQTHHISGAVTALDAFPTGVGGPIFFQLCNLLFTAQG